MSEPGEAGAGAEQRPARSELNQRQERIIDLVRERGFVAIEALADHFAVTPQTVRRDINQLCDQGLMRRYHGGAGLPSSVENLAYQTRQVMNREAKARIAAIAAAEVPDNASLFINIGTTTEEVAKALVNRRGLRIITNNLNVASILSENRDFEVIIAGGLVRSRDKGIVGEATLDAIRQFKVDIGIIGISGIDDDGSLLDFDYREVRAAQAIIGNSRRVFLVTDHTKFGRNAMVRLGHLDEIDAVFTDRPPSKAMREILKQADVALHIAAGAEEAPASAPVGPAAP